MDGDEASPSSHIILNDDRAQLHGLDSIHNARTYIVKLDNSISGNNTGQIFPNYVTSVDNSEKDNDGTEIAFEIIQEPLLNDSVVVENRLFFEPDYSLDKTVHHQKENLPTILIERNKDEPSTSIIKYDSNQESLHTDYPVTEIAVDNNGGFEASTSTCPTTSSSLQSGTLLTNSKAIKLEPPDLEHDEKGKGSEVIKKTMVEAFVKMIVCRKITVQKKDAKTGDILDVDVKLEEEEPVVLGVDYVETTEDVISGHASKHNTDNLKGATAADGGLKVLSAVPDKSPKISKSLFSNSFLQSTLQKGISKVLQSDKASIQASKKSETNSMLQKNEVVAKKVTPESDSEWMEEFNDDSADYVPYLNSRSKQSESRAKNTLKDHKSLKSGEENRNIELSQIVKIEQVDPDITIPKKRGRKRKWDKTIGLASNMKKCQFCNKHFDSVTSCSKHMRKGDCVSSQFCFICSKTFDSEQQLEIHISTHRNENKRSSYECDDCRRSYRTKAGYVKHFKMGTCKKRELFEDGETGDFTCELCDSRFSSLDYLQLHHYKVHENPKDKHLCPDCGKTFYSLQGFQRHRSGRPCTEPLKCHICGKTYKAKESFKLHMKHHKSEITGFTYNCDECGRSYMTEAALTKHKLLHTGIKPYKCNVCGKEFAMRYQVKDHARMHSGEKPYSCALCGVSFSNRGHLGRHVRSHENGTLLRRGRPKKVHDPGSHGDEETEIKPGQTLKTIDGQTIQVIDGQIFNNQGDGPPMIIQADTNTIIIAEGWPDNSIPVSVASGENIGIVG